MQLPTFSDFATGPGGRIATTLGVSIARCTSWRTFTAGCSATPGFAENAKKFSKRCSTGERVVLGAVLYAADYADLADTVAKGTWRELSTTDGAYREAVLAALARVDA